MKLKFDFSNVMEANIGNEHGLAFSEIEDLVPQGKQILAGLREKADKDELGFYNLPSQNELCDEIESYAESVRKRFDYFVHIGIGGSALGPIALQTSLRDSHYN